MAKTRNFISFVRQWRTYRDLTQTELAEKVGVTHPTVAKWESGKIQPGPENMKELASALGCSIGDIFERNPLVAPQPEIENMEKVVTKGPHLIKSGLPRRSRKRQKSSIRLGEDPVRNSELILRAVRNMQESLNEMSDNLGAKLGSLGESMRDLGDAIQQADEIERTFEENHKKQIGSNGGR